MWSFGCLLCELYSGYPIFAGDSEQDQLFSIMEVLGFPDKELIEKGTKKSKFFDENGSPKIVPNTRGKIRVPNSIPIIQALKNPEPKFLDLVKKCLCYNPDLRYTPDQALAHEWIVEGLPKHLQNHHITLLENDSVDGIHFKSRKSENAIRETEEIEQKNLAKSATDKKTHARTGSENEKIDLKNLTTHASLKNFNIHNRNPNLSNLHPLKEELLNAKLNQAEKYNSIKKEKSTEISISHPTDESKFNTTGNYFYGMEHENSSGFFKNQNSKSYKSINAYTQNNSMSINKRRRYLTLAKYHHTKNDTENSVEMKPHILMKDFSNPSLMLKQIQKPSKGSQSVEKTSNSTLSNIYTPKNNTAGQLVHLGKKDDGPEKKFYFPTLRSPKT